MCGVKVHHIQHAQQIGSVHPHQSEIVEFNIGGRLSSSRSCENCEFGTYINTRSVQHQAEEKRRQSICKNN